MHSNHHNFYTIMLIKFQSLENLRGRYVNVGNVKTIGLRFRIVDFCNTFNRVSVNHNCKILS